MAWYSNSYRCYRCKQAWTDEWSCQCDDDCPHCGARHSSPSCSEDLTYIVAEEDSSFLVLFSPDTAQHKPNYQEVARFGTKEKALVYVAAAINAPSAT